jgi:hypothetical protein
MYIDVKIAIWQRINLPKEFEEEFKTKLLNQEIKEAGDAVLYLNDLTEIVPVKLSDETELLRPENNHGEATFQVFDKNHNLVFSNDLNKEQVSVLQHNNKQATV